MTSIKKYVALALSFTAAGVGASMIETAPADAHLYGVTDKVERGIAANRTNAQMNRWGERLRDAGTGEFNNTHRGLSKIRGNMCKRAGHNRLGGHKWRCRGRMVYGVNKLTSVAFDNKQHALAPCYRGQSTRQVIGVFRNVTISMGTAVGGPPIVRSTVSPVWGPC